MAQGILEFDSQADAQTAKAEIDLAYGCPYNSNGYTMTEWSQVIKHPTEDRWGVHKPENNPRIGVLAVNIIAAITPSYTEPDFEEWCPPQGDD